VLEGLDVSRVHEFLPAGYQTLYANLIDHGREWPVVRRPVQVFMWTTGFSTASPVQWSGTEHEADYDAVGFWDEPAGGRLVVSAALGAPAHLGPDDHVMIAAGDIGSG
jgi:hypothetical protein